MKTKLLLGTVVLSVFVLAGCSEKDIPPTVEEVAVVSVNEPVKEAEKIEEKIVSEKKVENTNVTAYQNETLEIAFSYPKEWGEIIQDRDDDNQLGLGAFGKEMLFFLAADNGKPILGGRGSSWGDRSRLVETQEYVDKFCVAKNKTKKCELKTNSAGVKYAKATEEVSQYGGGTSIETSYYIFHPKSEFRGIIVSTEGLRINIDNLEKKLDALVESLRFIN